MTRYCSSSSINIVSNRFSQCESIILSSQISQIRLCSEIESDYTSCYRYVRAFVRASLSAKRSIFSTCLIHTYLQIEAVNI